MQTASPAKRTLRLLARLTITGGLFLAAQLCFAQNCAPSPSGLVSWWTAERNADDIADGNNGALLNGATFAVGKVGQAFSFDGTNDYVQVPDAANLRFTNAMTVEAWIYVRSWGGHHREILSKWGGGSGSQRCYTMTILPSGTIGFGISSDGGDSNLGIVLGTGMVPTNEWLHTAAVYDGSTLTLYVNGITQANTPWTDGIFAGTAPLIIGYALSTASYFDGLIDEPSLYNRALSAAEIQSIYAAGSAGKCVSSPSCAPPPAGLINWWRSEGSADDDAGSMHGTLYCGTTFAAGKVGQAFSFDGVNDCVTNAMPGLTNIVNSFTMEFWALPTAGRAQTAETTSGTAGLNHQRYAIFPDAGPYSAPAGAGVSVGTNGISVFEHGGAYLASLLVYDTPITNWTHIAVVYEDRQPKLFLNGNLVRTGLTSTRTPYPSTWLGEYGDKSLNYGPYCGLLDEVSIYDRSLSASELQAIYAAGSAGKCPPSAPVCVTPPAGLVSWWQGEGDSLDTVSGNSATLAGAATYAPGKVGSAFTFQGASAYALVADSPSLRFTNALTIEVWIHPKPGGSRYREIVSKWEGASSQRSYTCNVQPSGKGAFAISSNGGANAAVVVGTSAIPTNQWSHLAAVYDGSAMKIYLNGVLDGTAAYSQGIFPGTVPLTIGSTITSGSYFDGLIDEPSLYNRALSATEIQAIYEAGIAGKCVEPILPFITMHPTNQIVVAGSSVVFVAGAGGTPPLNYQWRFNGTNLPGASAAVLNLTNVNSSNMGTYAVSVSNHVGGVSSAPVVLDVRYAVAYGNGMLLTSSNYTYVGSVDLQFWTVFPSGSVFYTLDGTAPSFLSTYYAGPFTLSRSATLRAITYNADFTQAWEAPPIEFTVIPVYPVTATTRGGGTITLDPPAGPYVSNSVVALTAIASNGWTFLHWLGDAAGAETNVSLTVNRPQRLEAVFGTTLATTVTGNGTVQVHPVSALYPYGTVARLTAVASAGNYFGVWGNSGSGTANPLYFAITNPAPTVSCLFTALGANQHALTVIPDGNGRVTVSPRANAYADGANVTLTAVPDAGQAFVSWSGDASGTQSPLTFPMTASKVITAHFSRSPALSVDTPAAWIGVEGCRLTLNGEFGTPYRLDVSTNLLDWTPLVTLTNTYGRAQFTDETATNAPVRLYRAVVE